MSDTTATPATTTAPETTKTETLNLFGQQITVVIESRKRRNGTGAVEHFVPKL